MKKCKLCKSTKNIERHHILPKRFGFSFGDCRENQVLLCKECHKQADKNTHPIIKNGKIVGVVTPFKVYRFDLDFARNLMNF
jgi:5-methylcytosine-specific restriction endonuclease McrA